ncbi:MAG TPA: aminoglycoside phosphotransferase family protein [Actinomycetota bacterium]|nr:aminoglycoside phosphotransferase family protein [Actinomycetota bacterium]
MRPTETDVANATRALKKLRARPVEWQAITAGGNTPASRWVVSLDDGRTAFLKIATDDATASWLRDEHLMYSVLRGASFMPAYLGWYDDGHRPVLAIEDVSAGDWPPPWTTGRIEAVLACLGEVASTPPPDGLPRAGDDHPGLRDGWAEVERERDAALGLGLFGAAWLDEHLPALHRAAEAVPLAGDALLHFDVRSDNVCFAGDRPLLVDWNWACVGNPVADVAFWLPSLHGEGGPRPDEILPEGAEGFAAAAAGYFVSHAARPPIPTAPTVRPLQRGQARVALAWAARALGIPPPS